MILRTAPTDRPKPTDEQIQAQSQQRLARNDRLAMAALVRSRGEQAFSAEDMAAVQVPTLGLIGSADANLAAMNQLPSVLPTLKVVVIEAATHGEVPSGRRRDVPSSSTISACSLQPTKRHHHHGNREDRHACAGVC